MRHKVHDPLNRLRIVTFSKKLLSSEIICLSLFMPRVLYLFCLTTLI
jgi:hypothetical protein